MLNMCWWEVFFGFRKVRILTHKWDIFKKGMAYSFSNSSFVRSITSNIEFLKNLCCEYMYVLYVVDRFTFTFSFAFLQLKIWRKNWVRILCSQIQKSNSWICSRECWCGIGTSVLCLLRQFWPLLKQIIDPKISSFFQKYNFLIV